MKKMFAVLLILLAFILSAMPTLAEESRVIYSGDSGEFIFEPGSKHSPTDLFGEFKNVVPGDVLYQEISLRNDASNGVKVKIYIRALPADDDSAEFLSQLTLKVQKRANAKNDYMFDAAANESAQFTDWVCLGTLYSGGEVDVYAILEVPVEMGNEFQDRIGTVQWEFMVEEYPIEDTDPVSPPASDSSVGVWIAVACAFAAVATVTFIINKKSK